MDQQLWVKELFFGIGGTGLVLVHGFLLDLHENFAVDHVNSTFRQIGYCARTLVDVFHWGPVEVS